MKTNIERTEERRNRFNGESVMLTKEEARRHDCIFLAEIMATLEDKTKGEGDSQDKKILRSERTDRAIQNVHLGYHGMSQRRIIPCIRYCFIEIRSSSLSFFAGIGGRC